MNSIPIEEKNRITSALLRWGIQIEQSSGKIEYIKDFEIPEIKAKSIYLIRHAETVAVVKHEFMSDTSDNCTFTENGIEILHEQAAELAQYDFDIALYGPIARVINTKNLIMQTPQSFTCTRVEALHGIDNTDWEYKSYFDLENDETFIQREILNNVFARTVHGSSWGTVIANCSDVIDLINLKYAGKRILLISQGSILRAMQILLRTREHPWDEYTVRSMYHLESKSKGKNYGKVCLVYSSNCKQ